MESNGKSVDRWGRTVGMQTGEIVWGQVGTNGQHAFFQLLHQGTRMVPVEFVAVARPAWADPDHQDLLVANLLAQAEALALGRHPDEEWAEELRVAGMAEEEIAARVVPGDRPSTVIMMPESTPSTLGQLMALHEHRVFVQAAVWGINPFDQWGVELGKAMAGTLADELDPMAPPSRRAPVGVHDPSTDALMARYRALRDQ